MSYRVVWTPSSQNEPATAWMAAPDRSAVTHAAHMLERDLSRSPLSVGESRRSSVERVAFLPPLAITFLVVVDDQTVFVTAVTFTG
jgi:hypothetical protein